jgi:hypothetical protein
MNENIVNIRMRQKNKGVNKNNKEINKQYE